MSIKNGKKMSPQKAFFRNGCVKRNLARFLFQKPFTHCQVILSYQLWNCTMPTWFPLATTSPLASTHSPYGHMHSKFMRSTHLFIGETMGCISCKFFPMLVPWWDVNGGQKWTWCRRKTPKSPHNMQWRTRAREINMHWEMLLMLMVLAFHHS